MFPSHGRSREFESLITHHKEGRSSETLDLPSLWWVFMRTRYAATCCRRASICFSKFLPSISRLKICSQEFLTCNIHEAIAIFRLRKIAGQFVRRKCVNRQIGTPACGKRQNLLSPRIERCVCEASVSLDLPSLWWVLMRTRYAATCCRRASICFSKF